MFIPLGGSVPTASTLMNFYFDPEIAAQLALGTSYITSVKGVREEAASRSIPTPPRNELIFPSDETLAKLHPNDPKMVSTTTPSPRGGGDRRRPTRPKLTSWARSSIVTAGVTPYLLLRLGSLGSASSS